MSADLALVHDADVDAGLVPSGEYQVAFERYALTSRFNRGSLELWFRILDYGEHFGRRVPRYYKVSLERRGHDKKPTFRAARHSAFTREFVAVFRKAPPAGITALSWFRDARITATVRTVIKDHGQTELPDALRYNVIGALTGKATQ